MATMSLNVSSPPGPDRNLLAALLGEALDNLEMDRDIARRRIEHAFSLVQPEYNLSPTPPNALAVWQLRKVEHFILANLESTMHIADVACLINLSISHFSRAFKAAKGVPYRVYVLTARVERAKHLLLTTLHPIAEISLICGFCDQSHLTRSFRQATGRSPRSWRRQMVDQSADLDGRRVAVHHGSAA